MRLRTRAGQLLLALLSISLLASACGGTEVLDTDDVAAQLQESLTDALGGEVAVECPDEVPLEEGAEFTCDATSAEGDFGIIVTQTDDQGNVSTIRESLDMTSIEEQIATSIEQLGGIDIQVECPDDVEVGEGNKFNCHATSERGELDFVVTQEDDFGTVTFRPKPAKD